MEPIIEPPKSGDQSQPIVIDANGFIETPTSMRPNNNFNIALVIFLAAIFVIGGAIGYVGYTSNISKNNSTNTATPISEVDMMDTKAVNIAVFTGENISTGSDISENIDVIPLGESVVFAAGGSQFSATGYQIDDSGEYASIYTVKVNYPEKPVTLILSAYYPGIWDISLSEGTKIQKIILGGYNGQKVSGISKAIPIEEHIFQNNHSNDFFVITEGNTTKNSLKKWGNVETISYEKNGEILIGNPIGQNTKWQPKDRENTPETYYNMSDNLAGEAGLDILIKKGVLRIATEEDKEQWVDALLSDPESDLSKQEGYPITDPDDLAIVKRKYTPNVATNFYVALKDFTLPPGMYWKYGFFILKGVSVKGDISNGSLYYYDTMQCSGCMYNTN